MSDLFVLANETGQLLKQRELLLTTAESCTGGGVAQAITEIPGSSTWFDCGFVTYSNASKMVLLNVPTQILDQHGAVSEETALAMCQGALRNSQAHIALSTTGIAGPDGGVAGKPVGTVCFAWACRLAVHAETKYFSGGRAAVRAQSVDYALYGLLKFIEENFKASVTHSHD